MVCMYVALSMAFAWYLREYFPGLYGDYEKAWQ